MPSLHPALFRGTRGDAQRKPGWRVEVGCLRSLCGGWAGSARLISVSPASRPPAGAAPVSPAGVQRSRGVGSGHQEPASLAPGEPPGVGLVRVERGWGSGLCASSACTAPPGALPTGLPSAVPATAPATQARCPEPTLPVFPCPHSRQPAFCPQRQPCRPWMCQ